MKSANFKKVSLTEPNNILEIIAKSLNLDLSKLMDLKKSGVKMVWFDNKGNQIATSLIEDFIDKEDYENITVEESFLNSLLDIKSSKSIKIEVDSPFIRFNLKEISKKKLKKTLDELEIDNWFVGLYYLLNTEYVFINKEDKLPSFVGDDSSLNSRIFKSFLSKIDKFSAMKIVYDVDYILDKISEFGIESLVQEEKDFLSTI